MSNPHLPPEILDYTIDILHDEPKALRNCCLVAKSWVPRTRSHLFAEVKFFSIDHLKSWKKTFPVPSDAPAHHTHTLKIGCPLVVGRTNEDEGDWLQAFPRVSSLVVSGNNDDSEVSLAPFHKFSPTLKSFRVHSVALPSPQLFNLVRSSPHLEDLAVWGQNRMLDDDCDPHGPQTIVPAVPPLLTGPLELFMAGGIEGTARRLLDLPNGIHFRKLILSWFCEGDLRWIMELVVRCSYTLEHLNVVCRPPCNPRLAYIDLSKATKLRNVDFQPVSSTITWIIMTLQTITSKHLDLRQIRVYAPDGFSRIRAGADVKQAVGEVVYRQWIDLDNLLAQLWESHSIRTKVLCAMVGKRGQNSKHSIGFLLPEITNRGLISLVPQYGPRLPRETSRFAIGGPVLL